MESTSNNTPASNPADDLAGLTPEEREVVLRGRAYLKALQGKPKFKGAFADRVADGMGGVPLNPPEHDAGPDADKPLI